MQSAKHRLIHALGAYLHHTIQTELSTSDVQTQNRPHIFELTSGYARASVSAFAIGRLCAGFECLAHAECVFPIRVVLCFFVMHSALTMHVSLVHAELVRDNTLVLTHALAQ